MAKGKGKKKKLKKITVKSWSGIIHRFKAESFDIDNGDLMLSIGSKEVVRMTAGYWCAVGYGG